MPVTGYKELAAKLRKLPESVTVKVKEAMQEAAVVVLEDMEAFTPRDGAEGGPHARDALAIIYAKDGLIARIGLPTPALASDFFWFRFLDGGTKGGDVKFWRRTADGKRTRHVMRVPARAALHIRSRAIDGNVDEVRRLVREAIEEAVSAL